MAGAEKLLGKGDMLFYPIGEPKPVRLKCAFVSDKEVERVVTFIKNRTESEYSEEVIEEINKENMELSNKAKGKGEDADELLPEAIELVIDSKQASVSLIQRKFKVGHARAGRIIDQMEVRGIVGASEGSKPRQVLMTKSDYKSLL
jgi:S-DNA-T family DNA segregation ATPase FtsK/SpoIIIE